MTRPLPTVIPAAPGWQVAVFRSADEFPAGAEVEFTLKVIPIVAWRIRPDFGPADPVCGPDYALEHCDFLIVEPGGHCWWGNAADEEPWDTLEEARAYLQARWERQRAELAVEEPAAEARAVAHATTRH